MTDGTTGFEQERPRLIRIATRVLGNDGEAEDIVQQAWLRLHQTDSEIDNLPGWLTTVTTRLCLDRLRSRTALPLDDVEVPDAAPDPADEIALADTVGIALQLVLDRLTPAERVAFVLHDTLGFNFATIAEILDSTPAASRKLASRARSKLTHPTPDSGRADWEVVDAFLASSRQGDFQRLLSLLAPDVVIAGDAEAILTGTPERIAGRETVAEFFNGAAASALPVFVDDRPGAAWYLKGKAMVAFDFTIRDGLVQRIDFRAAPAVLEEIIRRRDGDFR